MCREIYLIILTALFHVILIGCAEYEELHVYWNMEQSDSFYRELKNCGYVNVKGKVKNVNSDRKGNFRGWQ